jgi:hypothetical protein
METEKKMSTAIIIIVRVFIRPPRRYKIPVAALESSSVPSALSSSTIVSTPSTQRTCGIITLSYEFS